MSEFSILVNSCDKYEDTWMPFFTLFQKYWPDFNQQIYLNSETKTYHHEGLKILRPAYPESCQDKPWGWRFYFSLASIQSEIVLVILDDMFIERKVDTEFLDHCVENLRNNEDVSVFYLAVCPKNNNEDNRFNGFVELPRGKPYRLNCQAALWKKEDLLRYIRKFETPWQFETLGSIRARRYRKQFYGLKLSGKSNMPIQYTMKNGVGIHEGKWVKENVIPLFQENGIKIDFEKRGFWDEHAPKPRSRKYTFKNLIRLIKSFRSLI